MNGINDADMLIDLASKDIKTIIQKNESQVLQPNYKLINRTLLIGIYKLQAITITLKELKQTLVDFLSISFSQYKIEAVTDMDNRTEIV